MSYCIYLRKSRADAEAEARGEGETLARHEHTLLELARRQELTITHIYREIVSGDSIAARPQMQALLQAVTDGLYDGVLVMEVERLARGDTIDQGVVAQAFRESGTLIVTPTKTYDPNNEFDEEYFEFSLFMSRREYKTIKRRMQAGRIASVKEGNYLGTTAPYGYRKVSPAPKVRTLEIVPEEAETVQKMFQWYLSGMGVKAITSRLNLLQIPPRKNGLWEPVSVRKILQSPIYMGKVSWHTKRDGTILADGAHPPIVSEETWHQVQQRRAQKAPAVPSGYTTQNYYHNLLYCANCGHQMRRRPGNNGGYMLCLRHECRGKVVSAPLARVDEALLEAVRYRIRELQLERENQPEAAGHIEQARRQRHEELEQALEKLRRQKEKLYTLLETEVYSVETFLERTAALEQQKAQIEAEQKQCQDAHQLPSLPPQQALVWLQYILDHFAAADPAQKNAMLLRAIRRIDYTKTQRMCYRNQSSDMHLDVSFL